jgi:hypothetical protein
VAVARYRRFGFQIFRDLVERVVQFAGDAADGLLWDVTHGQGLNFSGGNRVPSELTVGGVSASASGS